MPVSNTDPLLRTDGFRRSRSGTPMTGAALVEKFSKTYSDRFNFVSYSPPKYSLRERVSFGAMPALSGGKRYEIRRKKSAIDRTFRKHVRNWSVKETVKWFEDALTRRDREELFGNVPAEADGKEVLSWTKQKFRDDVCRGDGDLAQELWNELRFCVEEYLATHAYDDMSHAVNFTRYASPKWTCRPMLEKQVNKVQPPGPGHYKQPSAVGMSESGRGHPTIKQVSRFAMPQGERMVKPNKNPGPGAYFTPVDKDHRLVWQPKWSIKGRGDSGLIKEGGPLGAYDVDKLGRKGPLTSPAWTLKARAPAMEMQSRSPGPAGYDQSGRKKKMPTGEPVYWPTQGEETSKNITRKPAWSFRVAWRK
mmetsp:Transcript_19032/g.47641  ORF Transcript_19032/g.47641 Transcript_19032/m.47641 type:complete len:363 (+) Transcript_19032:236-1324(+)|eukprot:CAMPEP_0178988900 /NCGR_PEP_ID=MMETSP0795-20121207/4056_1 /TAXON_ID=88552 /ORGANISM="Amoebophrya sp., Strain Ameob2" /LENGTH=362 /DNA_ID=CAMNT_0020680203 /DNA_START=294 /DNA_END=1382 /DNA_ORIENTATION=+